LVCETEVVNGIIKFSCLGCVYGSSIEDFDVCMSRVIDKILETKKAERVILSESREHEYDWDQVKMLVEIANIYDDLVNEKKLLNVSSLKAGVCDKCFPKRYAELQILLLQMLKRDPIGAYVRLRRMIRHTKRETEVSKTCKSCAGFILRNVLVPIQTSLEKAQMIKAVKDRLAGHRIGDRSIYRELFHPLVRPNFMLTRYMSMPPKKGELVERYKVPDNISVEVFRIPGKVRFHYHVTPPEFQLSEEKYSILDEARRYMVEHRPSEAELTDPEKTRTIFMNIGRDLIGQIASTRRLRLSSKEVNELANILARYTAGFGILEIVLADEKIQDVYINSPIGIKPIYISHGDFEECETNLIPTREDAEGWATRFRMLSGRPLDEANPVLDTELFVPGGRARVAAITRTLSPEGLAYAFRRHRDKPWTYPLFMNVKFFPELFSGLMSFLVDGSRTLLIAGTRSSGKTALLGSTMIEIMKKFRIVSVEDTFELPVVQLRNLGYNIERLKSRSVITRVEAELPAEEALRTALRLGDSCLIMGEVRSKEAIALYEAMRIGALANVVAGTIHGESAYGVFDRVVNDLGVPPTSFKATDIIVICNMLRSADGLHRFRRIVEVTEVRKNWKDDPMAEGGFVNLMEYSAKEDKLKPTETLLNGESYVLNEIAKRVGDWHGDWEAVWNNIQLRSKIKKTIVDYANKLKRPEIMEADWVSESNEMFHMISDEVKQNVGTLDSKEIYQRWNKWFENKLKAKK